MLEVSTINYLSLVTTVSAAVVAVVGSYIWSVNNGTRSKSKIPEKWVKVGEVSQLIIYPVKSCQGIIVEEASITSLGLKVSPALQDRVFMVVDGQGNFQAQTKVPGMALINVSIHEGQDDENKFTLSAPGMPSLLCTIPKPSTTDGGAYRLFHDKGMKALDCGDSVATWLSEFLEKPEFRLVYHSETKTQRTFDAKMRSLPNYTASDTGAFQNETAFLVIAEESVAELNTRLEKKVSMRNFRPSIVIKDVLEPFSEIQWSCIRIGKENSILKAASPCARCPFTTIDPDNGVVDKTGEPLKTLAKMKIEFGDPREKQVLKNRAIMGLRMGVFPCAVGSTIKVGDPVYTALL